MPHFLGGPAGCQVAPYFVPSRIRDPSFRRSTWRKAFRSPMFLSTVRARTLRACWPGLAAFAAPAARRALGLRVAEPNCQRATLPTHSTAPARQLGQSELLFGSQGVVVAALASRTGGSIVLPFSPLVCGRGPGGEGSLASPRPYSGEGPGVRAVRAPFRLPPFPFRLLPFSLSPLRCSPFPTYSSRSAVMPPCFSTGGGSSIYHDKRLPIKEFGDKTRGRANHHQWCLMVGVARAVGTTKECILVHKCG